VSTPALDVVDVCRRFGGIQAVRGVSFRVAPGTVLGVIGPNGSGKTTLVNLISGAHRAHAGTIRVGGAETTGRAAHAIAGLGVARTFQNPRVFHTLTVRENLRVSVAHRSGREWSRAVADEIDRWLGLVGLGAAAERVAHELSGGQQKLVEFARAMVHRPTVVLMDEPFAGVHPSLKELMRERILERNREGTSFVIVSHEIPDLMRLCGTVVCMSDGRLVSQGTPEEVTGDPRVIEAYLGGGGSRGRGAG
jgi:branched-chain amino acid transport system ATP-binding protein